MHSVKIQYVKKPPFTVAIWKSWKLGNSWKIIKFLLTADKIVVNKQMWVEGGLLKLEVFDRKTNIRLHYIIAAHLPEPHFRYAAIFILGIYH